MTKGILLFCFDTKHTQYHKILEKCVHLIRKNLKLEITVVTNFETYKKLKPLGFINYKFIDPELGNSKIGKEWKNVDRHLAYELSPYDTTLVIDIDYFCYTDNLLQFMDTKYDFLIPTEAYDLTQRNTFNQRVWSMIPMVWATVIVFKKTPRAKSIFDTVKYIKKYYQYFVDLYRIDFKNFRNDYAFSIALNQVNGHIQQKFLPGKLPTLPGIAKVLQITENTVTFSYDDKINYIENQDVHILDKELINV